MSFTWPPEVRQEALTRYLKGASAKQIAAEVGCSVRTVHVWASNERWRKKLKLNSLITVGMQQQIAEVSAAEATPENTEKLEKLTKSLERMNRIATNQPSKPVRAKPAAPITALRRVLRPDYGLYPYQREFIESTHRFRIVTKSRQIGFSYVIALGALLGAVDGRNQLVVSASEEQALIIMAYIEAHAERLNIQYEVEVNTIKVGKAIIRALSTNFRTVQGRAGDVWFDEFAWLRPAHQKRLWGALVPSITAVGGRITITSTPFLPGTLHWEISENNQNRWPQFVRWRFTIHDAVAQGMPIPGGIEDLQKLFDADTWAMFYLCQYAEGADALLNWSLLHSLTHPNVTTIPVARMRGGVDIGRTAHRFAVALIGQEIGQTGLTDRFVLRHTQISKGLSFADQEAAVVDWDQRFAIEQWAIDRTGLGMDLAERLTKRLAPRAIGVHFDAGRKQRMALNLLKLAEDRRLILPNDPDVLANLHSVQKIVTANGVRYDAPNDEQGHGDLFWAVALAAEGKAKYPNNSGVKVELWS